MSLIHGKSKLLNKSVRSLLIAGNTLYILFGLDIAFFTNWSATTALAISITALLNFLFIYVLYTLREREFGMASNLMVFLAFTSSTFGVALAMNGVDWMPGSFFYLFLIVMAVTEVNFFTHYKFVIFQYAVALSFLVYGLIATDAQIVLNERSYFGFALLLIWKGVNQYLFRFFLFDRDKEVKLEVYHSTVATLRNELNNTSHAILGFAELMERNGDKKDEYLNKVKTSISTMSDQIKRIEELENIEYSEVYAGEKILKI